MTANVFLIPGVMGSELLLPGDQSEDERRIWYYRGKSAQEVVDALLDEPNLTVGGLVKDPLLFIEAGYAVVESFLAKNCKKASMSFFPWPYDWRKDIHVIASLLHRQLRDTKGDIFLVAHSMGGLVARLLLETYPSNDSVVSRIKKLFLTAVPNFGAPLALFRVLGFNGLPAGVMSGERFKRLSSRPNLYPTPYQLLPAPGVNRFKDSNGGRIDSLEIMALFPNDFIPAGVDSLRRVHDELGLFRKPESTAYYFAGGVGEKQETIISIDVLNASPGAKSPLSRVFGSGDGTVPEWSSLPIEFNQYPGVEFCKIPDVSHTGIFEHPDFQKFLADNLLV